jgi:ATP-binding cassette, subfamily G (WHITE), member 2, SNQ2
MADRGHSEKRLSPDPTSLNDVNSLHIDVRRAEEEFNTLSRQLSNRSANSIRKSIDSSHDPEKGLDADEEYFNLREYLTSSNDANQKAGIRHKVIPMNLVIWSLTDSMSSEYRGHLGEFTGGGRRGIG